MEIFKSLEAAQAEYPNSDYLILSDKEADEKCAEEIKDSLWAFSSSFLASCTGLDECIFKALQDKCEGSNDAVLSLVEKTCGLESFIDDAISADGRGHFLARYDHEEREIKIEDQGLFYVYRVN